jgi:hypothetical protein
MSIHTLKSINNLNDPIKQFLIDFNIVLPAGVFNFSAEQLELRAQSFSFPTVQMDATEVWWGGHHRQFAGKQTRQGDWNVTFTEVWSGDVIDGFRKWMQLAHNFTAGTIALHEEYMTSAKVNLLNPDLYDPKPQGAAEKALTLKMLYPTQVQVDGTINPSSSDPVNMSCTLHYSYFLMSGEQE